MPPSDSAHHNISFMFSLPFMLRSTRFPNITTTTVLTSITIDHMTLLGRTQRIFGRGKKGFQRTKGSHHLNPAFQNTSNAFVTPRRMAQPSVAEQNQTEWPARPITEAAGKEVPRGDGRSGEGGREGEEGEEGQELGVGGHPEEGARRKAGQSHTPRPREEQEDESVREEEEGRERERRRRKRMRRKKAEGGREGERRDAGQEEEMRPHMVDTERNPFSQFLHVFWRDPKVEPSVATVARDNMVCADFPHKGQTTTEGEREGAGWEEREEGEERERRTMGRQLSEGGEERRKEGPPRTGGEGGRRKGKIRHQRRRSNLRNRR